MQTEMGMNNRSGMFVKATDDTAEIMFHLDDIMHRILANSEGRIKVIRGSDDIFDTQVDDYVFSIDKPTHPVPNNAFLCGYYEEKLAFLLGNDQANAIITRAHELATKHDEECKADI